MQPEQRPAAGGDQFVLLNDQPVAEPEADLLGAAEVADDLASLVVSSRGSAPLVVAVDAGWGMGKSTLLRLVESRLAGRPGITTVRFNAWTASGHNALEGLIKSVLLELDRNVVRRQLRRLARQRHLVRGARIGLVLVARFFGLARMVDELWKQLAADAKSRNDLRDLIHRMLCEWVGGADRQPARAIVVFVDDLDRCSDAAVVQICEAVKLYLDTPGLIFFLACDQSVIARGVATSARGGAGEGWSYLEKIVQVAYRVPPPAQPALAHLIQGYAQRSGTASLVDGTVTDILAERVGRNPRRIKRIINSFVVEHQVNPAWQVPPLGSTQLVTAVLLQHLYPAFYGLLVNDEYQADPIEEFLAYAALRERAADLPADVDSWWEDVATPVLATRQVALAGRSVADLFTALQEFESRLPEDLPALARNPSFVALLRNVEDPATRQAIRAQLLSRPLGTEAMRQEEFDDAAASGTRWLAGWRIVCVDDNPASLGTLESVLSHEGADVRLFDDSELAEQEILARPPDAVISDITRGDDRQAGFASVERLRNGGYRGPVVFFTGVVTPERRQRSEQLAALDIVAAEQDVIAALRRVAAGRPELAGSKIKR